MSHDLIDAVLVNDKAREDAAAGMGVNNLHTPYADMSPYRPTICLSVLGWSVSELARRTDQHRNTIQRWLDRNSSIDPAVAAWLEKLAAFHIANPSPAASQAALVDVAAST